MTRARHKYPAESNPPAVRPCFRVDGHGQEPVYVEEHDGWLHVRQGTQRVRLACGLTQALADAILAVKDSRMSVKVYDVRWRE